jgi:hypothetical protein
MGSNACRTARNHAADNAPQAGARRGQIHYNPAFPGPAAGALSAPFKPQNGTGMTGTSFAHTMREHPRRTSAPPAIVHRPAGCTRTRTHTRS